jgi:hypothetical protein
LLIETSKVYGRGLLDGIGRYAMERVKCWPTATPWGSAAKTRRVAGMVKDNLLVVTADNEVPDGRDPACGVRKSLRVEYLLDGEPLVATAGHPIAGWVGTDIMMQKSEEATDNRATEGSPSCVH